MPNFYEKASNNFMQEFWHKESQVKLKPFFAAFCFKGMKFETRDYNTLLIILLLFHAAF
jgi:hypothetical protein